MIYGGGSVAWLLLTMIGGYWVLERAASRPVPLRWIGQLIGAIVIVVSLIGVSCKIWALASDQECSYYSYGMMKPWHHGSMPPAPAAPTK